MTKPRFRIKPWPFEQGEVATLLWLSSPRMAGEQAQWRFSGLFRSDKGKVEDLEFDWAMLPLLRVGQRYRDAAPMPRFAAPLASINLFQASEPEFVTARSVLARDVYRLYKPSYWQERCWVWTLPGQKSNKVVLPTLIFLQGLFARDDVVTTGLLDANFLDGFERDINGDALELRFSASFKLPTLAREREAFLTLLARLLCDPSFETAFRSVALGLMENPSGPLTCSLPDLHAVWKARVLVCGTIRLVQELVRAEPLRALPVKRVTYRHPLFPKRALTLPTPRTSKNVLTPTGYTVDTEAPVSHLPRAYNKIPAPSGALSERSSLNIENIGEQEEGTRPTVILPKGGKKRTVSFADTGQGGTVPQAGVRAGKTIEESTPSERPDWLASEAWTAPQEDGLDEFRAMLVQLKVQHPVVNIQFRMGPKTLEGVNRELWRPYAVVLLGNEGAPPRWLIEFGERLNRPLSTLVVTGRGEDWQTFKEVIAKILEEGLNPSYWWDLKELMRVQEEEKIDIRRLPHMTRKAKAWAKRVSRQLSR